MKKALIFTLLILLAPLSVNALEGTISTEFNPDNCTLTVTGKEEGHEAVVQLTKGGNPTGLTTGSINQSTKNYSVEFVLTYNEDTNINITVADENGQNEMEKNNITIPACTIVPPENVNEIFDGQNSLIINDSNVGFDEGDEFELEFLSHEKILEMLHAAEGTEAYDNLKGMYDAFMLLIGEYRDFKYYININIRKNLDNYSKGFILNIKLPKEDYKKLNGLKLAVLDEENEKLGDEISYEYDEENEILAIKIDGPSVIFAYLDNDYKFLDNTANPIYNKKNGNTLTLKVNADLSKLKDIFMDGKKVDSKNYSSKSGSTVITFKKEYMQSLSLGKHNVVIHYSDGSAKTVLTVTEDANNPKTGDSIQKNILILGLSIIGLTGIGIYKKKNKHGM